MFVAYRVRKIAEITSEANTNWKYCLSSDNLIDFASRCSSIARLKKEDWFTGPMWTLVKRTGLPNPGSNTTKMSNMSKYQQKRMPTLRESMRQMSKKSYWQGAPTGRASQLQHGYVGSCITAQALK